MKSSVIREIPFIHSGQYAETSPRYRRSNAHLHDLVSAHACMRWRYGNLNLRLGHILTLGQNAERPLHQHRRWEITFVLEGCVEFQVEEQVLKIRKGEVFLMPPETVHRWIAREGRNVMLGFFIDIEAPDERVGGMRMIWENLGFHFKLSPEAGKVRDLLLKQLDETRFLPETNYPILHMLLIQVCEEAMKRGRREKEDRTALLIRNASAFMEANMDQAILIQDIAEHVGIGERQLNRIFRAQLGKTVQDLLLQHRLTRASELLRQGYSAKYAYVSAGFGSASYFTRCFKKHLGITPSQFASTCEGAEKTR